MEYSVIKQTALVVAFGRANLLNCSNSSGFCSVQVIFTVAGFWARQVCDLLFTICAAFCVLPGWRALR